MLPDHEIDREIAEGNLGIDPYEPGALQPASVDLRLGGRIWEYDAQRPNLRELTGRYRDIDERFVLQPGDFVLGTTVERIRLSRGFAASVDGRSSVGRLGVLVHVTAGFIDPGFEGHITLEIHNLSRQPVLFPAGARVSQIKFFRLASPAKAAYGTLGNRYQGQSDPMPSGFFTDAPFAPDDEE